MEIDVISITFRFGYCGWNDKVSAVTNGSGLVTTYAYDALGRRISTTTLEGTVRHVYDGGNYGDRPCRVRVFRGAGFM